MHHTGLATGLRFQVTTQFKSIQNLNVVHQHTHTRKQSSINLLNWRTLIHDSTCSNTYWTCSEKVLNLNNWFLQKKRNRIPEFFWAIFFLQKVKVQLFRTINWKFKDNFKLKKSKFQKKNWVRTFRHSTIA